MAIFSSLLQVVVRHRAAGQGMGLLRMLSSASPMWISVDAAYGAACVLGNRH